MIFYLFITVNQLTYVAVFQISNFFAILSRIASVLRLEEYKKKKHGIRTGDEKDGNESQVTMLEAKNTTIKPESPGYIKVENASYNWGFRMS